MNPESEATRVTAASRSNLAFSFLSLPVDVRRDMEVLYAFCRIVDDIVDESDAPLEQRRARIAQWRSALACPLPHEPALAAELREVAARRGIPVSLLEEILDGVAMDLDRTRYAKLAELAGYCHRVAGCVGLASLHIFGCTTPEARTYALELGNALQWTNILRDVADDLRDRGRVYLPLEDLQRFGLRDSDLPSAGPRFAELMEFEAARAQQHFAAAVRTRRRLSRGERRSLSAAEFMRDAYGVLLRRMRADGFRVFERRYRLSAADKLLLLARSQWRRFFP
jgi:phytoene synthase